MKLTDIRARIRFLLGDISSSSYSDPNIDTAINNYYHKIIGIAFSTCGEWEVNGEMAYTDLVAAQQEYVLPSNIISLYKIEANFTGDTGDWVNLPVYNWSTVNGPLSNKTTNTSSTYCRVFDESLFLEFPVGSDVSGGLRVWYVDDITELSDDDDEPEIPEFLVSYLVHGASRDYTIRISNNDDYNKFDKLIARDIYNIEKYYSNRLPAIRKRITGKSENYK